MSRLLPPRFLLPCRRFFTTTSIRPAFSTGPSPPRLPPKEQEEFERLQRASTGAFSTPRSTDSPTHTVASITESPIRPQINQSPASRTTPQINQSPAYKPESDQKTLQEEEGVSSLNARIDASGDGEELHPDIRRGARPEFEGDVNPKTGEVGGPKNEPLRWGHNSDWSYNGRVTDF